MKKDYIIFESPCPVLNCKSSNPNRIIKWRHAPCYNSTELLDKNGNIICNNCFEHFFIFDAYFSCGNNHNEFRKAGVTQLLNALAVLISNPNLYEADLYFIMALSQKIKQRAKDR